MPESEQIPPIDPFTDLVGQAQELHSKGLFTDAQTLWQEAVTLAPDDLEKGRAIRGDAASAGQAGNYNYALTQAQKALALHRGAVDSAQHPAEEISALREQCQSSSIVGRLLVGRTVRHELAGNLNIIDARHKAQKGLIHLDGALLDIQKVEARTKDHDQYTINTLSHLAIAQRLYGDSDAAAQLAKEARARAWQSEKKDAPTSANLSTGYRLKAVARAVVRAYTATAINSIATQHSGRRRTLALKIAADQRVGL